MVTITWGVTRWWGGYCCGGDANWIGGYGCDADDVLVVADDVCWCMPHTWVAVLVAQHFVLQRLKIPAGARKIREGHFHHPDEFILADKILVVDSERHVVFLRVRV